MTYTVIVHSLSTGVSQRAFSQAQNPSTRCEKEQDESWPDLCWGVNSSCHNRQSVLSHSWKSSTHRQHGQHIHPFYSTRALTNKQLKWQKLYRHISSIRKMKSTELDVWPSNKGQQKASALNAFFVLTCKGFSQAFRLLHQAAESGEEVLFPAVLKTAGDDTAKLLSYLKGHDEHIESSITRRGKLIASLPEEKLEDEEDQLVVSYISVLGKLMKKRFQWKPFPSSQMWLGTASLDLPRGNHAWHCLLSVMKPLLLNERQPWWSSCQI